MRKYPALAYGLAALIVVVDQVMKWWILHIVDLPAKAQIKVLSFFDLTWVPNRGVSFGMFRSPDGQETVRWVLAAFAAVVIVALAIWARSARRPWFAASLGLIMGGAIGNLIDRVRLGHVTDFLDFSGLHFPWVFNVADAAINVGIALLLIETLLTPDKSDRDR